MALSPQEITQIVALIDREGGIQPFIAEMAAANATRKQAAGLTTLAPAITVTVQDWPALQAFVAASSNVTLYAVMAALAAAATAKDASQLGPLFVQLYAAVKAHLAV